MNENKWMYDMADIQVLAWCALKWRETEAFYYLQYQITEHKMRILAINFFFIP